MNQHLKTSYKFNEYKNRDNTIKATKVRIIDNYNVDIDCSINGQSKDRHTKDVMIVESFEL